MVISFDKDGNFLEQSTGNFRSDITPRGIAYTWDEGVYVAFSRADTLTGALSGFIARTDLNDFSIWVNILGNAGVASQEFFDITATGTGNIIGVGYYTDGSELSGMPNPLDATGVFDVCLAVYSSEGAFVTAGFIGNGNIMAVTSVEYEDADSSIYMGGVYQGTFDGEDALNGFNSLVGKIKFDPDAVAPDPIFGTEWWNTINSNNVTWASDVEITKSGLAICGQWDSRLEIDTLTVNGRAGDFDAYSTLLDFESGEMIKTHTCGSALQNDNAVAVAVTNLSYILGGTYMGNITMGAFRQNNRGGTDGFMTEVDLSGRYLAIESGIVERCERSEFDLDYDLFGAYEDDNIFIVEMSVDAPFNNPVIVDTIEDVGQGTVTVQMDNRLTGSAYLCRIRSTNPKSISNTDFRLIVTKGPSTPEINGLTSVREGNSETYSVQNTQGSSYEWVVEGGNIVQGQGTNAVIVLWGKDGEGSVSCTETNGDDCKSNPGSIDVTIKFPKSIASTLPDDIKVYPTLVSDQLIIENTSLEPINATLMSVDGQELTNVQNMSTNTSIDMASMAAGVYMLKVNVADENYSVRVVKY